MLKTEGASLLVMPGALTHEQRTFKCNHCDGTKPVRVYGRAGAVEEDGRHWCDSCDALVCNACKKKARDHRCIPWERKMEIMEARGVFIRDVERLIS